ncbi:DNA polymerase IV [Wenyingzhuangia sp. 2_MG-2023]|uniref:DNA polymerase IV n=1 Tax=Wenyingzhuangia sp. 2_MG-2023 TaxID=3062639 RepID=UPI0026E12CD2|nr:DNA polymerase IV [Wenyingzhuangia sp. 2_MG-2023]MDO6736549.1 DNA polymerase IV [Wenyingzhuangia sp. 2_MG-2023]MDO6801156.1 DNA polymerase IV [Wenyingzhuangia sp. 1_MG-2023]
MENPLSKTRKIIHVDMDAFFASVAQLDNPDLRGKPIAVGSDGRRGVISAASYEARKFGVKSAMPGSLAKKMCPELIFVNSDFARYKEISNQVRAVFYEYTDLVEPLSLDEAYLDVTVNKKGLTSASKMARLIRQEIFLKTGLNASAGIAPNKFVAKIASDVNKPNGQKTITPDEVVPFLEKLAIGKFYGVGKVTTQKMYRLGIFTGADLKSKSIEFLEEHFKSSAEHYYNIVRGIHNSPVRPSRTRKSVGAEHTYLENLTSEIFILEKLKILSQEIEKRLVRNQVKGRTVTLKIKYSDFSQITRSKTLEGFVQNENKIFEIVKELLFQQELENSVRLLGISINNLDNEEIKTIKQYIQLKLDL